MFSLRPAFIPFDARLSADGVDLPVDLDHAIARKASLGERADAIGWVKALQPRADGLYARIEWLTTGLSALAGRTHRYVSPTFRHDDAGTATWLHSIALVAAPALSMPALASAFGASPPERLDPLALAAAAAAYQAAQAASGKPMRFADAVVAFTVRNRFEVVLPARPSRLAMRRSFGCALSGRSRSSAARQPPHRVVHGPSHS